jgi:hypothetical protein
LAGNNWKEDRRSGRVTLRVPLRICEPGANKGFRAGEAYSVKVSLWGGLLSLPLESTVNSGQKLMLTNQSTGEAMESQIVYLGAIHSKGKLVGVEFLEPSASFWGLTFPPVVPRRSTGESSQTRPRAYA